MAFQQLHFMRQVARAIDPELTVIGGGNDRPVPVVYVPPNTSTGGTTPPVFVPPGEGTNTYEPSPIGGTSGLPPLVPITGGTSGLPPLKPIMGGTSGLPPLVPIIGLPPQDEGTVTILPIGGTSGLPPQDDGTVTILPILDDDKCNYWGPAYWCEDEAKFKECIQDKGQPDARLDTFPACQEPRNNCLQGPAYWCASDKNFKECIQSKGYKGTRESFKACEPYLPDPVEPIEPTEPIGSKKCTWGPAYWCASDENFKECIQAKGYKGTRESFKACKPYLPKPGEDDCTQGPAFWCASDENFQKCVQAKGYEGDRASLAACKPYVPKPIGENKCILGPAYWCSSDKRFKECNKVLGATRQNTKACEPYLSKPIGEHKCTQGPTYWCASKENFDKCVDTEKSYEEFCSQYKPQPVKPGVYINAFMYCPHCGKKVRKYYTQNYLGQTQNFFQYNNSRGY